MKELCVRCGRPTPYDIYTPIFSRLYYIYGSGQLCEGCWKMIYGEIKTITLPTPAIPTLPDQELYNQLINKPTLTDEDRVFAGEDGLQLIEVQLGGQRSVSRIRRSMRWDRGKY